MQIEVLVSVSILIAITMWMALKHAVAVHQASQQRAIAQHGAMCQGRVVAIQRPFMLDTCTRLYFDFSPDGSNDVVRACHVDRRAPAELHASLPAQGMTVTVRYLPHQPRHAVIGRLIS